jgi:hypothetical protein
VIGNIGLPGKDNKSFDKVDVGFALKLDEYEVRVTASDTFSATFLVTKLNNNSTHSNNR